MRTAARHWPSDRALASLGVMLLVCSCAVEKPPPPPPAPAPHVFERPRPHRPVPRPARKPTPPPEIVLSNPGSGPMAAQHDALIGLDQPEAMRLLGPAAATREEPPATVWRYKTANCELDLYFYLDLRSGRMRTLHYAFKGDTDDSAKRRACVQAIIAARST